SVLVHYQETSLVRMIARKWQTCWYRVQRVKATTPRFASEGGSMTAPSPNEVTQLLLAWSDGDQTALEELIPLVYAELHRMAEEYMRRERPGHPLQTTELVNETYLRLVDLKQAQWQNRAQFFAIAANLMRRILVDFA